MTASRAETFDGLYSRSPDPWDYETSRYEREKYAATLKALPAARYRNAVEFGCSIGVLTAELARRCDTLTAVDVSRVALEVAKARSGTEGVHFVRGEIPADWPDGAFDLLVFSEILYFLSAREVQSTVARALGCLEPGGHILLVNWLGECRTELTGDDAAEMFTHLARDGGCRVAQVRRTNDYRIDLAYGPNSAAETRIA